MITYQKVAIYLRIGCYFFKIMKMEVLMYNPDDYMNHLYEQATLKNEFIATNQTEWQRWQQQTKEAFITKLGHLPLVKSDLKPMILEEVDMPGYKRQRVSYSTDVGLVVPAYVLIPEGNSDRYPAVVACHGHGYGSREIVALMPDGSDNNGNPGYQKNFAIELVKRGYIVIVPDLLGFGDRRLKEDQDKPMEESSCHRISDNLLMLGKTMAGLRVYDIIRTIDYLESRGDVDHQRIGCMGISGGGLVCAFSSVIDPRIKVSVVSGYTNTFKDSIMGMAHCIDNFIPDLLEVAEMPDIIGLIAPRPLLVEAGKQDPIFPIEASLKAYSQLQKIYGLLGEENSLDIDVFDGDHQISGRKAYDWFDRWL